MLGRQVRHEHLHSFILESTVNMSGNMLKRRVGGEKVPVVGAQVTNKVGTAIVKDAVRVLHLVVAKIHVGAAASPETWTLYASRKHAKAVCP